MVIRQTVNPSSNLETCVCYNKLKHVIHEGINLYPIYNAWAIYVKYILKINKLTNQINIQQTDKQKSLVHKKLSNRVVILLYVYNLVTITLLDQILVVWEEQVVFFYGLKGLESPSNILIIKNLNRSLESR